MNVHKSILILQSSIFYGIDLVFTCSLRPSSKPAIEHDSINTWRQAKTKSLSLGTENK